jgi:hypothetical protein
MLLTIMSSDNSLPYEVVFGILALLVLASLMPTYGVRMLSRDATPLLG